MSKKILSLKITVRGVLLILGMMGVAWQAGCRMQTEEVKKKEPSKLEKIKAAGKIVVGTSADYPPYEFHLLPEIGGEIVGIDIDIAEAIAQNLNVKLEIKNIVFSNLFAELTADRIDLALAGLSPTESRKKIVDFSREYYQAIQNMLIRAADNDKIKQLEDLRGKIVGTQKSSIQEDIAKNMVTGAAFVFRESIQELVDELRQGKLDAVILEKPVAATYTFKNKDLLNLECNTDRMPLGSAIAVKKGNDDLLARVNQILDKLIKENKIIQFVQDAKVFTEKI